MKTKLLALSIGAALLMGSVAGPRPAAAGSPMTTGDLVKTTAALVLAEDPPKTRSEVLEEARQKDAAAQAVEKKQEVDTTPYYKKWWFWALTGVVVGGTVALGVWAIEPSKTPARSCSPGVLACFGDGRGESR